MDHEQPAQLDALASVLGKAKSIMKASDMKSPIKTSKNNSVSENYTYEEKPMNFDIDYSKLGGGAMSESELSDEQIRKSNLPNIVKESMLSKKIKPTNPFGSVINEDLIAKINGESPNIKQKINETNSNGMITVSKSDLKQMISEGINDYFKNDYEKRITEMAIKKTLNVLLKEGKLITKKKI